MDMVNCRNHKKSVHFTSIKKDFVLNSMSLKPGGAMVIKTTR